MRRVSLEHGNVEVALCGCRVKLPIFTGTGIPKSYDAVVISDSPAGFWPLNESSGTTAFDQSGNGNNGTYTGSFSLGQTSILPTDTETCVNFTGGQMAVPDAAPLRLGAGDFSVEVWFDAANFTNQYVSLVDEASRPYCMFLNPGGSLNQIFFGIGGTTSQQTMSLSFAASTKYHLVWTYLHSSTTSTIYVNGSSVGSTTESQGSTNSSTGLTLAGNPSSGGHVYAGFAQKLAVYNHQLSSGRVSAHYSAA